ncbi:MAG: hypothetical protein H0X73_05060 [Chthoniobacterales bacterium]|nr:hypothetical protein [Chthoniobacterales bacterium]
MLVLLTMRCLVVLVRTFRAAIVRIGGSGFLVFVFLGQFSGAVTFAGTEEGKRNREAKERGLPQKESHRRETNHPL